MTQYGSMDLYTILYNHLTKQIRELLVPALEFSPTLSEECVSDNMKLVNILTSRGFIKDGKDASCLIEKIVQSENRLLIGLLKLLDDHQKKYFSNYVSVFDMFQKLTKLQLLDKTGTLFISKYGQIDSHEDYFNVSVKHRELLEKLPEVGKDVILKTGNLLRQDLEKMKNEKSVIYINAIKQLANKLSNEKKEEEEKTRSFIENIKIVPIKSSNKKAAKKKKLLKELMAESDSEKEDGD